jgi:hypothetical protein
MSERKPALNNAVRSRGVAILTLGLSIFSLFPSCDEPFPVYQEPSEILRGSIAVAAPETIDVVLDSQSDQWFVNPPLILNVSIMNMHDDLLSGEARVNGLITIHSFSEIPRTIVVPLATGSLLQPPVFQGNIAIGPGASAEFSTLVVPKATDGKMVFEGLPGPVFGPIDFIATGEVQLFDHVQPIEIEEYSFTLSFREL